jgi:hypothetical protein
VEGVLIHEINHILLGHHEIDATGLDADVLDITKDLIANEYNDRPAPAGTATLADFPAFPPGESVLARYAHLRALLDQAGVEPQQPDDDADATDDGGDPGDDDGEDNGTGSSEEEAEATDGADSEEAHDDDATPTPDGLPCPGHGSVSTPGVGNGGMPGDTAALAATDGKSDAIAAGSPAQTMQDSALSANSLTVRSILAAAARQVAPDDLSSQEQGMLVQIRASSAACGQGTAGAFSLLSPSDRDVALVPWKSRLRRYVGEALLVSRPSYARPSRRFPDLVGIVPGAASCPGKPVIQAVIDTSGSMSDAMLNDIATELRFLARRRRVIVVQCDDVVQSVERFTGRIDRCTGRGGTDFRPVFEPSLLRRTKADVVIVFSDGYGPAPKEPPRVPVIWALTTPCQPPATWGDIIRLPHDEVTCDC